MNIYAIFKTANSMYSNLNHLTSKENAIHLVYLYEYCFKTVKFLLYLIYHQCFKSITIRYCMFFVMPLTVKTTTFEFLTKKELEKQESIFEHDITFNSIFEKYYEQYDIDEIGIDHELIKSHDSFAKTNFLYFDLNQFKSCYKEDILKFFIGFTIDRLEVKISLLIVNKSTIKANSEELIILYLNTILKEKGLTNTEEKNMKLIEENSYISILNLETLKLTEDQIKFANEIKSFENDIEVFFYDVDYVCTIVNGEYVNHNKVKSFYLSCECLNNNQLLKFYYLMNENSQISIIYANIIENSTIIIHVYWFKDILYTMKDYHYLTNQFYNPSIKTKKITFLNKEFFFNINININNFFMESDINKAFDNQLFQYYQSDCAPKLDELSKYKNFFEFLKFLISQDELKYVDNLLIGLLFKILPNFEKLHEHLTKEMNVYQLNMLFNNSNCDINSESGLQKEINLFCRYFMLHSQILLANIKKLKKMKKYKQMELNNYNINIFDKELYYNFGKNKHIIIKKK